MKLPRFLKKLSSHEVAINDELLIYSPVISSGKIQVSQDINIDNHHSGSIRAAGYLVIGPNALISGSINARSIDSSGQTRGNISADESINIRPSASVKSGKLQAKQLTISAGSHISNVNITTI